MDSCPAKIYTYNADGQRVRRKVNGVDTWQIYGLDGELLAEYAANGASNSPQKEYGYRNGQLLVTATAPVTTGAGLQGQYYDNMNFTNLKLTRTDATVNFDWGGGTPDPSVGADTFTVRWTGKVEPQYSQTYTLYTQTDDGVRLWVNGQLLVDKWIDQGPTEWSGQIALTAGLRYDLTMEFYENGGGAMAKLSWSSASQAKQIIPQSRLYPPGSNAQADLRWLVTDQLGTPRMIFDKTGSLANVKRHDYLPFGEELYATQGLRTTSLGYSADGIRQQFTSYERDNETDLDYAQARYYASVHGRFTSVDPLMASATAGNPQTFNRYTYALNSPQTHTDPTGMLPVDQAPGGWGPGKESTLKAGLDGAFSGGNYSRYLYTVTVEAAIGDPIVEVPQSTPQQSATTYPSAEAAAVDALVTYNPTSIQQNLEYAGEVCRQQQRGLFIYTVGPAASRTSSSSDTGICPAGTTEVADWHTHAARDPALITRGFLGVGRKDHNERFSDSDKISNNQKSVSGYLATPKRQIKVFYPGAPGQVSTRGRVRTLRQRTP